MAKEIIPCDRIGDEDGNDDNSQEDSRNTSSCLFQALRTSHRYLVS